MPISLKNTNSILPYVRYSPQANEMTIAGEDNKPHKISFIGKNIAIDIENGSTGWLLIDTGMRSWKPFPINEPPPSSPGPNFRRGFSILVYAPKLFASPEAFEMCSSTAAHLSFCERLFNEAEPQFGKGSVPIVRIVEAEAIKIGKGKSRDIHFEIVKWVPRPAAFTEAMAKLKAAGAAPNDAAADASAQADDFADDVTDEATDGVTEDDFGADTPTEAASKEEPTAEKPKKSTKKRKQETQPEQPKSNNILDDDELPDSMKA